MKLVHSYAQKVKFVDNPPMPALQGLHDDHVPFTALSGNVMDSDLIGILFYGPFDRPPMQEGRFFNDSDFFQQRHLAVVGQNMKNNIYDQYGEPLININGINYSVIGIIGTTFYTPINDCIYYNLDSNQSIELVYMDAPRKKQVDESITKLMSCSNFIEIDAPPSGVSRLMHYQSGNLAFAAFFLILLIIFYRCVVKLQFDSIRELLEIKLLIGKSPHSLALRSSCFMTVSSLFALTITYLIETLLFSSGLYSLTEHLLIVDRIPLEHSLTLMFFVIVLPAGIYNFFYTRMRLRGAFS